jgi:6-pyruvoyltetrahydropterin/6-carboxytetrahydropterin synthase
MTAQMEIFREFTFDAAHRLPNVPDDHKCHRMHGHTYRVTLRVAGIVEPQCGWVVDFADIVAAFTPIRDQLDHHYLNDIDGLGNPTSENLAVWIWERVKPRLPTLAAVTIQESSASGCTYRPGRQ